MSDIFLSSNSEPCLLLMHGIYRTRHGLGESHGCKFVFPRMSLYHLVFIFYSEGVSNDTPWAKGRAELKFTVLQHARTHSTTRKKWA